MGLKRRRRCVCRASRGRRAGESVPPSLRNPARRFSPPPPTCFTGQPPNPTAQLNPATVHTQYPPFLLSLPPPTTSIPLPQILVSLSITHFHIPHSPQAPFPVTPEPLVHVSSFLALLFHSTSLILNCESTRAAALCSLPASIGPRHSIPHPACVTSDPGMTKMGE